MEIGETLYATTRQEFRTWLEKNHRSKKEIWLLQYKKAAKKPSLNYVEAVEEAICFGWTLAPDASAVSTASRSPSI